MMQLLELILTLPGVDGVPGGVAIQLTFGRAVLLESQASHTINNLLQFYF